MEQSRELVSLVDLASEMGCNKSKIAFYARCGVIRRVATVGKTGIYDKTEALARLRAAEDLKDEGYTLAEIGERFK